MNGPRRDPFAAHAYARARLLETIVGQLASDDRFTAAWLGGSFGRGDADNLSDLDLFVVVADEHADILCRRDFTVGAGTTAERLAIISSIAEPAIIHENNHNAPSGGTFTAVIYAPSAQQVDWTFVPHKTACRPVGTRLLFEHESMEACTAPVPLDAEARRHQLAERHAFFCMMVVPTIKYALRGDGVYFHILLDMLDRTARDIEQLLRSEPRMYQRGSYVTLRPTEHAQLRAVDALCKRVQELEPEIRAAGVSIAPEAAVTIEGVLSLRPS